ncbi:HrpJ domain-containing protein [uncultured Aureimonas sp.]|uniref:HrpJ domain-containing protein n=1 Tax=uncultured Aureimonas sp. TaxID=1604662 RepID=UPI0025DFB6EC|nr:HrpJ domain-containing protein [uncultured Aureimonas sp.]
MAGAIETTRQNLAALAVTSPVGAEVTRAAQGDYRGQTVETSSETSKLEDAKEEIGMAVAHRSDKRTLGQRQVRQGQGAHLEAIARIADYYDKLPDMPRESELQGLVEDLTRMQDLLSGGGQGGGPTKDDVLALLGRFDSDPTHQFAGLEIAREFFAASGATVEFQALLEGVRAEYERGDLGREVRAGFAVAELAAREAATLETDPAAVRETYRQLLRETPDMNRVFDAFRCFDPLKRLDEVVDLFLMAAGRDMAATGPSSDPAFLHALITEMSKLKTLGTVMELLNNLCRTTDRLLKPGERPQGSATDATGLLLAFSTRATSGLADARALLARYGTCSAETQLVYANGLRLAHAELPDDVMPSLQSRLQQVAALMMLQDRAVAEEELEYEGRGSPGEPVGQRAGASR